MKTREKEVKKKTAKRAMKVVEVKLMLLPQVPLAAGQVLSDHAESWAGV